jgi:hypothetical protein
MAKKLSEEALRLAGPAPAPGLLDAAREVFGERGFSGARIAETMRRAGADVDSRYCYPSLMDELFITLWENHHAAHAEAARLAVAQARRSGASDPAELFETGARAFLQGSWRRRDLALLFSSGDAPPGFAALRQRLRRDWLRRNTMLFRLNDSPEDRLYAASLTSLIGRGAREVATTGDFRQAETMINAVTGYARLLAADRPGAAGRHYDRLPGVTTLRPTKNS